jgi:hypothetical protein
MLIPVIWGFPLHLWLGIILLLLVLFQIASAKKYCLFPFAGIE